MVIANKRDEMIEEAAHILYMQEDDMFGWHRASDEDKERYRMKGSEIVDAILKIQAQ